MRVAHTMTYDMMPYHTVTCHMMPYHMMTIYHTMTITSWCLPGFLQHVLLGT